MSDENDDTQEEVKAPTWEDLPDEQVETFARLQGWDPDKKRYDDKAPLSAREYVESLPDRHQKLAKKFTESDRVWQGKVEAVEKRLNTIAPMFEKAVQSAYERGLQEAEAKLEEAISNADGKAAREAQRTIDDLKANAPKADEPEEKVDLPPAVKAFVDENRAIFSNPQLATRIGEIDAALGNEGWDAGTDRFVEAKRRLAEEFPDEVKLPRRQAKPQTVESPAPQQQQGKSPNRQFGQLSPEHKAAFEEFYAAGNWKNLSKDQAKAKYMEYL